MAEVQTLNPEVAKSWLERNTKNRPINLKHVAHLAKVMKRGEWKCNGEAIKISEDNVLLDGQHRLLAILDSGATIQSLVVYGLSQDVFPTMDRPLVRSAAQVLAMNNCANSSMVSSALNLVGGYDEKTLNKTGGYSDSSPNRILKLYHQHPEVHQTVSAWDHKVRKIMSSRSAWHAAVYICSRVNKDDADRFFNSVVIGLKTTHGEPMTLNSPEYVLRRTLESQRGNRNQINAAIMAIILKAWNAMRIGRPITTLSFRQDELFPIAK